MSARDVVEARHSRPRKRRLRCNDSNRKGLSSSSREVVVTSNARLVASSSQSSKDRKHSNSHAVSRSKPSVGPVHLKRNNPRSHCNSSSRAASVLQRRHALNRKHSQNTNGHRKRRRNNSRSRSVAILGIPARAKGRNHKS